METVIMNATVLQVYGCELLVCDHSTSQEIIVHTTQASCFVVGENVSIWYNGAMTLSIPPQITAVCIQRSSC